MNAQPPAGHNGPLGDGPDEATWLEDLEEAAVSLDESLALTPVFGLGVGVIGAPDEVVPPAVATGEGRVESATLPASGWRQGFGEAGPVALAGLAVNGVAALVTVAIARLLSSSQYGEVAQLLGLFFVLSMPGSAVQIGVVRRLTALRVSGRSEATLPWIRKLRRTIEVLVIGDLVISLLLRERIARALSLTGTGGVVAILVAAGIWILLSVDRGVLQSRRRYSTLAGNLVVEGSVRTVAVVGLVALHAGVAGYMFGVLLGEVVATIQARWVTRNPTGLSANSGVPDLDGKGDVPRLGADITAAFFGLALLGLLQNIDVILLGRYHHAAVGPYAAISVASKALVFGALALGSYLLPEATIRWNEGHHALRPMVITLSFLAVPTLLLGFISVVVPRQFLSLVFSPRLDGGSAAFVWLVAAMACLAVSVLFVNYLFGTGSRWIVLLLAGASSMAAVLIARAGGRMVPTAQADLWAQATLVVALGGAFVLVHHQRRRQRP